MSSERSAFSSHDEQRVADLELSVLALLDTSKVDRIAFEQRKVQILEDRANAIAEATSTVAVDQRPVTVNNIVDELMARMHNGNVVLPTVPDVVPVPTPGNIEPVAVVPAPTVNPIPAPTPSATGTMPDPFSTPSRAGNV